MTNVNIAIIFFVYSFAKVAVIVAALIVIVYFPEKVTFAFSFTPY